MDPKNNSQGQPSGYGSAPQDYNQPVAYDQNGNPLYAHPPQGYGPQVVHISRPINPVDQPIPPEIMQRYEASKKKYPNLNLSKGEYVINAVKRHPIGILQIWIVAIMLMILFSGLYFMLFLKEEDPSQILSSFGTDGGQMSMGVAGLGILAILILIGAMIASYIYSSNRFYLTNESVIQEIQTTLLARHEQTVSLSNIEDASYKQNGILPHLFNYGTIRLSTEGDETTYSFSYVANPKRHLAVLNNAVEAFKNGRSVDQPS